MNAHKVEALLTEDVTFILRGLAFDAADAVEVIILEAKTPQTQEALPIQPETNFYPMHGKVVRYDEPTEPLALDDGEVLQ